MKKLGAVLVIVFFIAGVVLSFLAGNYMSNKEYMEERTQICRKYISFAIDTVQKKGRDLEGETGGDFVVMKYHISFFIFNHPFYTLIPLY